MKLTDLVIDNNATLGTKLLLVNIQPFFDYVNGKRSDVIKGYRYEVAVPLRNYDKLSIKIEGSKQLELSSNCQEVVFDGLELYLYFLNGSYDIGARATGIRAVNTKNVS